MTYALPLRQPSNELSNPEFRLPGELSQLCPTSIYDAFWHFAAERQSIYLRRLTQPTPPWTTDPILGAFKFTNVYRASDRVSQFLIQNVIYDDRRDAADVIFRILLFKLFNKIETWQLLEREAGEITRKTFSVERFNNILSLAFERQSIYSAAYIMPSGSRFFPTKRKHSAHLLLLEYMLKDDLPGKVMKARNLETVFRTLISYPMIGDFLAYQYAIDINYSDVTQFEEGEFIVAGPGARSGIQKCFSNQTSMAEADIIRLVTDLQEHEFANRNISFQTLGGRHLQLIDIQNIFCEIDKYARVRFPLSIGISGRSKIKQRFKPSGKTVTPWFPPKWRINEKLGIA